LNKGGTHVENPTFKTDCGTDKFNRGGFTVRFLRQPIRYQPATKKKRKEIRIRYGNSHWQKTDFLLENLSGTFALKATKNRT